MSTIEELYAERSQSTVWHNDIWEHMGVLRKYAGRVATICEIGTRSGNSTTAFLAGLAQGSGRDPAMNTAMLSFDIEPQEFFPPAIENVNWYFIQADSQHPNFKIPRCEMLFIDGCHKYESVKADLKQADRVWLYLILHDTDLARDKTYGDGVCRAMEEFLEANPEWAIIERFDNCNGLTVLGRNVSA